MLNGPVHWLLLALMVWAVLAYLLVPVLWKLYYRRPGDRFAAAPRLTHTADHHPGDPVNLALAATEEELLRGMLAAGWSAADPITLRSSVRIALDTVLHRPDDDAPVSNLFLFGRHQDFAFELPVGNSPRQRHHVRFWLSGMMHEGRPVWFAAATFDEKVGFSHTTGQVTHHIGPDVDAERDLILRGLSEAGVVAGRWYVDGFQQPPQGRNGGGDPWRTDGRLGAAVLRAPQ